MYVSYGVDRYKIYTKLNLNGIASLEQSYVARNPNTLMYFDSGWDFLKLCFHTRLAKPQIARSS